MDAPLDDIFQAGHRLPLLKPGVWETVGSSVLGPAGGCFGTSSHDAEDQRWRTWFRSTAAHQCLTLDDRDMALDRRHVLWVASLQVSAVVFENKSYEGLMHRRTILFLDRSRLRLLPGDLLGPVTIQRVQA